MDYFGGKNITAKLVIRLRAASFAQDLFLYSYSFLRYLNHSCYKIYDNLLNL